GFFPAEDLPAVGAPVNSVYGGLLQHLEPRELREPGDYGHRILSCKSIEQSVRQDCFYGRHASPHPVLLALGVLTWPRTTPRAVFRCWNGTRSRLSSAFCMTHCCRHGALCPTCSRRLPTLLRWRWGWPLCLSRS